MCVSEEEMDNQSRRHGGFWGLIPPNKPLSLPNWNMKHHKLVEFLSNLYVKPPCTNIKPPRTNVNPPYWRLSGNGSVGDVNVFPCYDVALCSNTGKNVALGLWLVRHPCAIACQQMHDFLQVCFPVDKFFRAHRRIFVAMIVYRIYSIVSRPWYFRVLARFAFNWQPW